MTLQEKLNTIREPRIPEIETGSSETITEFWDTFVAPKLIPVEYVKEWWEILKRYIEEPDALFAIRTFGNGRDWDRDLRRGFYNIVTNDTYRFFYTDNFFTAYFYKMAYDRYVPSYEDFKETMISRKFPARFGRSQQSERDKAAISLAGKDPYIANAGYKISHIVNAGADIWDGRKSAKISDICKKFFPRGEYEDWTLHEDPSGNFYARDIEVDEHGKELLKAHFLRLTCPMNFILTPKRSLQQLQVRVKLNDIGESDQLQKFAMKKYHELYGNMYEDFLSKIAMKPDFDINTVTSTGDFIVGIQYGTTFAQATPPAPTDEEKTNQPRRPRTRAAANQSEQEFRDWMINANDIKPGTADNYICALHRILEDADNVEFDTFADSIQDIAYKYMRGNDKEALGDTYSGSGRGVINQLVAFMQEH
ncbi:hypothetical protein [Fibrobacter sp.]|uniref:hypothetical protein n=1 Tax=Fibrobacter sp. TaxID=35828 RepID=UPI00388F8620